MQQVAGAKKYRWWPGLRTLLIVACSLAIILSLVRWGGSAVGGPLLWSGVGLLSALLIGFGLLTWWLYGSPLTVATAAAERSPTVRQVVAMLVLWSGTLFVVGGFWDEVWHRRFGGFGNDFLWPPHMLIYGSLGLAALFALGGIVLVLRSSGGVRQRFRHEPMIGLLALMTSYLLASLPSDQLWHRIYGKDLTAWSLPHLLIAGGFATVMLIGVGVQLSLVPLRPWQGLRGLRLTERVALLFIALATMTAIQIGATEWDSIRTLGEQRDAFANAFWHRPVWLYPVVLAAISLFSGTFTLHALRRAGAATLVGLVVVGLRLLLLLALGGFAADVRMSYVSHLLVLPPLVALDLWYATRLAYGQTLRTLIGGNLFAGLVLVAVDLPLIGRLMAYPPVNRNTLPAMIATSLVIALAAGWAGATFGRWLGGLDRPYRAPAGLAGLPRRILLGAAALTGVLVLLLLMTARPPA